MFTIKFPANAVDGLSLTKMSVFGLCLLRTTMHAVMRQEIYSAIQVPGTLQRAHGMAQSAPTIKRLSLELGGNAPLS